MLLYLQMAEGRREGRDGGVCECASEKWVHEATQYGVLKVSERGGSPTAGEQGDR